MIIARNLALRKLCIPELVIPTGSAALIGPNGSGKTTFLRILAGVLSPEKGFVSINGRPPGELRIGFVNEYPDRNLLFSRVLDEIAAPLRFTRAPCDEISRKVKLASERAGLSHLTNRRIHTLSGGEKTLVALLAATIHAPGLLILDEFDSHLDDQSLEAAEQVISASGAASVLRCTQNMDVASRSGTLVALFGGKVRASGNPGEVFSTLSGTCYVPFGWRDE
ncbi:MAG: energy-coupling factor ABC transporter ATP-binding protein [Methanoregulaceae archaeon]|nr:energy-coupling factor ABC transporter ATP-binding protein [Methanoregulaceae archaeon]